MKLNELIHKDEILDGNVDLEIKIESITSDSRNVQKNSVFVAIKGEARDGNEYILDAINNGAIVIVTEQKPQDEKVPHVMVKNARSIISKMYSRYYGLNNKAKIIAVTGTNGKSTVSYFIYNILRCANKSAGLISTVECLTNDKKLDLLGGGATSDIASAMTTPDPEKLYGALYEMQKQGIDYVVLETSSHAIEQSRLDGLKVDFGVFTNLSSEHLDYHKTIKNYFFSKSKLFEKAKVGIVNIDDAYGKRLVETYKNIYSFSIHKSANFSASQIEQSGELTSFVFNFGEQIQLKTKMIGEYNVYNASLASSVAVLLGIEGEKIKEGIEKTEVKGRLERVYSNVYIDYAHTPIATEAVLKALKENEKGKRIIALFGCGGQRDVAKRAKIGKIASSLADVLIITSDNSRSEEPLEIIKDILEGVDRQKMHMIIPKRKDAILYACSILTENDVLILLGKGHENYEIDKSGKHYFDERVILSEVLGNDKHKAEVGERDC